MRQVDNNIQQIFLKNSVIIFLLSVSCVERVQYDPVLSLQALSKPLGYRLNQNNIVRGGVSTRTWVSRGQCPCEAAFSARKAKTRKEEHLYPNPSILSFAYRCTTDHVDHLPFRTESFQGLILQNQSLFFIFSQHNHSKVWFLEISLYLFFYFSFSVFVVIFVMRQLLFGRYLPRVRHLNIIS